MREFFISGRRIADDEPCWVIAEIGSNHQGSVQTAMEMIRQAKMAGADSVKFQVRDVRSLFTPEQYDRPYESENAFGPTYGLHREALNFSKDQLRELRDYSAALGIVFFATAFDMRSVDVLDDLDVPAIKISSFDVRSLGLIRYAAATKRPLIISTGTADWETIDSAHAKANEFGGIVNHALLHCTSEYPAPAEHLNLGAIPLMRDRYPFVTIGYSNHFAGISMPLVAYVLGARIIEVHFTLNRTMKGTDHAFSLEPDGLRRLVRDLERARVAMGDGVKRPLPEEMPVLAKMNKSLPLPLVDA